LDPSKTAPVDDHPLSTSSSSQWSAFFKDKELIEEIDKDAKRTLPGLHFFNNDKTVGEIIHYEALKRILFIYAKLNPGIRYVQGMNEILGPIYYIFASDPNPDFKANAEADAFFCFTNVMSEIRDNFIKTLDKSMIGIQGLILKLNTLLHEKDPELWENLESKAINPQFYSFRWLTLLLSQEFALPDVLRLWDSLFADQYRFEFLLYACCAMLVLLRESLLDGTFADNLKQLQSYPIQDIHTILNKGTELRNESYQPPSPRPKPPPPVIPHSTHQQAQTTGKPKYSPPLVHREPARGNEAGNISPSTDPVDDKYLATTFENTVIVSMPYLPVPFEEDSEGSTPTQESHVKTHPLE